jgi:hypothetical protein
MTRSYRDRSDDELSLIVECDRCGISFCSGCNRNVSVDRQGLAVSFDRDGDRCSPHSPKCRTAAHSRWFDTDENLLKEIDKEPHDDADADADDEAKTLSGDSTSSRSSSENAAVVETKDVVVEAYRSGDRGLITQLARRYAQVLKNEQERAASRACPTCGKVKIKLTTNKTADHGLCSSKCIDKTLVPDCLCRVGWCYMCERALPRNEEQLRFMTEFYERDAEKRFESEFRIATNDKKQAEKKIEKEEEEEEEEEDDAEKGTITDSALRLHRGDASNEKLYVCAHYGKGCTPYFSNNGRPDETDPAKRIEVLFKLSIQKFMHRYQRKMKSIQERTGKDFVQLVLSESIEQVRNTYCMFTRSHYDPTCVSKCYP